MALALGLAGASVWQMDTASGQQATVRVAAPTSVSPGASSFEVRIEVQGVPAPAEGCETTYENGLCGLASYEWELVYDPAVIELTVPPEDSMADGGFLGSTGRAVTCQPAILPPDLGLEPGHVRFGCTTVAATPLAPSGGGLLSTVTFRPIAPGTASIGLAATTGIADTWGEAIPTALEGDCLVVGTGSCTAPTPLPTSTAPAVTGTPGGGGTPAPTATPTPAGPVPTPTPVPPGWEAVHLAGGGCQFEAWTGANGTTPEELAGLVGPAGNLQALWAQQPAPTWKGYSPEFPAASDMGPVNLLDVLAVCTGGPGDFVRPLT